MPFFFLGLFLDLFRLRIINFKANFLLSIIISLYNHLIFNLLVFHLLFLIATCFRNLMPFFHNESRRLRFIIQHELTFSICLPSKILIFVLIEDEFSFVHIRGQDEMRSFMRLSNNIFGLLLLYVNFFFRLLFLWFFRAELFGLWLIITLDFI